MMLAAENHWCSAQLLTVMVVVLLQDSLESLLAGSSSKQIIRYLAVDWSDFAIEWTHYTTYDTKASSAMKNRH